MFHKYRRYRQRLLLLLFISLAATPALSQPDSGAITPSWLQLSLEQRTRFEQLTNPFRPNTSSTERYFPLRTRLRMEIGETYRPIRFIVEFQDSRVLNDEERLYSLRSNINQYDLLQAHLQLNADSFPSRNSKSRILVGRFTMDLGKRRLAARNNMRNTTNAFDGLSWTLAGNWDWTIRTFVTRPVGIDPYSPDVTSRRYFWGAYFSSTHYPVFLTDIYYLGVRDVGNYESKQNLDTIGGRIYRLPKTGAVDYEIESAWQFGKNGLLDHSAYLYHGELGFSFNTAWRPRMSLHYDYVSGDRDPEDRKSGRFDSLYGARSFEYPPTGIYGPIYRSNIEAPGLMIDFNPADILKITAAYRKLQLAQSKDAWIGSGFQDTSGNSGKSLGQNLEIRFRLRANYQLTVEWGYARFFKGAYLHKIPEKPFQENSNYFYIATEFKTGLLPF